MGRDIARSSAAIRQRPRATWPATRPVCTATRCAVRVAWGFCVAIQFLYHDRGAATRRYTRARDDMAGGACDTAPRAHDTTPSAHNKRSQGSGWAPYAPNPVLTQCTVYSHCLDQCSWTLFTGGGGGGGGFKK